MNALILAVTSVTVVVAQSTAPPEPEASRFEVASVRAAQGASGGMINTQPGGRFIVVNMSLASVITTAYGIRPFQLVEAPSWVETARFDITALTGRDEYASVVQMRPLIQRLLAERFQMQVSREQRVMETYALVRIRPDTLGPEMRPSNVDCSNPVLRDPVRSPLTCGIRSPAPSTLVGTAVPAALLASALSTRLNTIIANETGLTGSFDFTLTWASDLVVSSAIPSDGQSLFTAVQEQLGLKLEARRARVDAVVIKRIERPTEN
jgi:uncharacterized protein (TIGR03435 family)